MGGRHIDIAARADASRDQDSRRRATRLAIYRPVAGAKAAGRALLAGGHGTGTSKGPAGALSHQSAWGIWPTEGRATVRRARLAGAPWHNAFAQPPDRERIAGAAGAGVDHSMSAGSGADPRSGAAQRRSQR